MRAIRTSIFLQLEYRISLPVPVNKLIKIDIKNICKLIHAYKINLYFHRSIISHFYLLSDKIYGKKKF